MYEVNNIPLQKLYLSKSDVTTKPPGVLLPISRLSPGVITGHRRVFIDPGNFFVANGVRA